MVMSREQTAGLSHTMKVDNSSIERVEEFKYLGTILSENSIQEEIKSRLMSGNASKHSVRNLLSSCLLPKIMKIEIYRTVIQFVSLYGRETRSLILREIPKLRVFENRMLKRLFGPRKRTVTGEWRKLHNEELSDP